MEVTLPHSSRAFTLIELLVVIAIIAILSVVVILSLNPAELLRQSHDANRLSDLATINMALSIYVEDVGGSMGTSSTTYVSIYDPSATSTLGDQCQGLGLPSQGSSTWACAASSTSRGVGGTGWIPLNLASLSSGSPLGILPQDSINQTSSGLYYTYQTNGTQYEVTSLLESQRYKGQFSSNPQIPDNPGVAALGTNLFLSALFNPNGLIGYWPLDEGSGSSTFDQSNNNTGAWVGASGGTNNTHYVSGKVGNYAGAFDGSTNYINMGNNAILAPSLITVTARINSTNVNSSCARFVTRDPCGAPMDYALEFPNGGRFPSMFANIG